eukprot:3555848-Rhodomonas_salina.1
MRMNPRIRADQVPDFSAPPEKEAAFVHRWIKQRKEIRGEIEDGTEGDGIGVGTNYSVSSKLAVHSD